MGRTGRLSAGVLVLCLYSSLHADELDRMRGLRASGAVLSLDVILEALPGSAGSRILEVSLEEDDGVLIYEIERLEAVGQVREYRINARTGARIDRGDE